jgi:NodT family efflux transporter outer membrane factor (OMF) lipoprotein
MKLQSRKTGIQKAAWFFLGIVILISSGCAAVGPDYVRPEVPVYKQWHNQGQAGLNEKNTGAQPSLADWWTALNDPKLSDLVRRAEKGNLDLKKAKARIREARALRGQAAADLYPTLNSSGSYTRSKASQNSSATGQDTAAGDLYSVGFDASWELDIFGGVRRSVEAAEATLQANEEDWRDVLVSLLAEVASSYVDVRTYQGRIAIAEENLKAQEETYQLTVWRNQAGLSDELAVQQARYNLESTRAGIPTLRTGLEKAMNRVAVLLGEQPGKVHEELSGRESIPVAPLTAATGIPADILRRRPDIRKAERNLAAQTAKIGVATADLYPKFTLNGSIGLEALTGGKLFNWSSRNYSYGPGISLPIFDGGSIRQNIEVQSALQEQYLIAYETAVLTALEEVENALVAYSGEQKKRQALIDAASAAKQAAELAKNKYQAGLADFTGVLDAERSRLSYEDELATSEGTVTTDLISLYKALGGGWTAPANDKSGSILTGSNK